MSVQGVSPKLAVQNPYSAASAQSAPKTKGGTDSDGDNDGSSPAKAQETASKGAKVNATA
jgi:hypothetical protein